MQLEGKVINFLGDSITEGVGVGDIPNCRYDNVIKKECKLKAANNYGIGGTRLAHQSKPSGSPRHDLCFCGRAMCMDKNADIVLVYGGVNDYLHGDAPLGQKGDKTPATFYGAVYYLMNYLKNTYKGKTVAFLTPAHCFYQNVHDYEVSPRPEKNGTGTVLSEYVKIVEETAKDFDIPTFNLYNNLGINSNNEEDKIKYTADGLHFNNEGHRVLANKVIEFLKSL